MVDNLEKSTHFTADEIRVFYSKFKDLIKEYKHNPGIKMNGFKDVFGISSRELAELTFSGFDLNGDGVIDFNEFVHGFSSICERAPQLERLKFGFNMFDLDKDGFIKTSELKEIMQLIAGQKMSYLPSDQIEVLVETAIQNFDPDKKGTIDFDTFKINVSKYTFLSNIGSVDLNKYLSNDPKK